MKTKQSIPRRESGNTLVTVAVIGGVMSVVLAGVLSLSQTTVKQSYSRLDYNSAYYHAENALNWAAQNALDNPPASGASNYYSTANGTLPIGYMTANTSSGDSSSSSSTVQTNSSTNFNRSASSSGFKNAWVSVVNNNAANSNLFLITASAKVNNAVRTVQTTVTLNPQSNVFDYEYFLNNWGWWWGSTITGQGAQRANWDFDFQGSPTVNGSIYAANQIQENEVTIDFNAEAAPFGGTAGATPLMYCHSGSPRVVMPNLLNFTNYIATAKANTSSNGIWLGTNQIVFGVQSNATTPGLYLVGTSTTPIKIQGTVVVPGDVVISGVTTGKGTLYVGGNLYIAKDLTYANGPSFSTPPETMTTANCNAWVTNNINKDLIAYAVRGAILGGDVTYSDWYNYCYNFPGSGLKYVGDESQLGQDGISGTPDDGVAFLHADGTTSAWYDADGDGVCESNYNYNTQLTMTTNRAAAILNYPTNSNGTPVAFQNVATDSMGTIEGILYCNHAVAMRLANTYVNFHGVVVSRNEQIVFQSYLQFTYDSRVNSRYCNNPNTIINLGLPVGSRYKPSVFADVAPVSTGL